MLDLSSYRSSGGARIFFDLGPGGFPATLYWGGALKAPKKIEVKFVAGLGEGGGGPTSTFSHRKKQMRICALAHGLAFSNPSGATGTMVACRGAP